MQQYTYEQVLDKIDHARRFGNLPGVEVTKRMLDVLGHPEKGLPFVHVAGTNGKGSVCAFLSSILEAAGKRVGTFTSPHLVTFEERITINGVQISKEEVEKYGNLLLHTDFGVSPTMFDYCLLMAVLYFQERKCDILVMETGLGGRLDSTNALGTPEAAVITKIGFDHTAILGDTLPEIASEKAGILKPGCAVILEQQEPEVYAVLKKQFETVNSGYPASHEVLFSVVSRKDIETVKRMKLRIPGIHQIENAAAAMLAARNVLEPLPDREEKEQFIRSGIENATWKGRMEILSGEPFLMVDGAHNGHGVHALAASLEAMYPNEKFHFIMGVMADKDYEHMIAELLPLALDFSAVTMESERALQGEQLAECIRRKDIPARVIHDLEACLHSLPADAKNIAFGSLYFIGGIEELWGKKHSGQDFCRWVENT